MTKVVRTTPIDRSKRTAVKGDVVSEVNIIHGKRKRRLSNNSFTDDYIVSSPKTPKKNKKKTKKTQQKKKELSESSEDDDEQAEESESGDEIIIPLSGNRNKYKIVDEDDEEEEMELKQEPEEEMYSLFSQELKRTERKKKQSSSSAPKELSTKVKTEEPAIAVCDCSEFGPIPVDPYKFFSKKIVDNVKRLGGEFPEFYDSRIPIVYNDVKFFSPDSLRLFTLIKWGGKQFKSSLVSEIIGLKIELFVIEEIKNFEFILSYVDRIVLIGDAADCVLGVDACYPICVNEELGDFWIYIIIDDKRKEAPHKLRLSTLLESLTIDETDYDVLVDVEFTQK